MNKNFPSTHLFSLLLFLSGCCIFWLLGGGKIDDETDNVAKNEKKHRQTQKVKNNRLVDQTTEEQGRDLSHNTSIKDGELEIHSISPATSQIATEKNTCNKKQKSESKNYTKNDKTDSISTVETVSERVLSSKMINASKQVGFVHIGESKQQKNDNTIRAVIHTNQKVDTENPIKLRLLDDVDINGVKINKNTVVYAMASFSADRLHLTTQSITYQKKEYPFNAIIYGLDGVEGIMTSSISDKKGGTNMTLTAGYKVMIKMMNDECKIMNYEL